MESKHGRNSCTAGIEPLGERYQNLANKYIQSLENNSDLFKLQKSLHEIGGGGEAGGGSEWSVFLCGVCLELGVLGGLE